MAPAGTCHALPLRGGITNESLLTNSFSCKLRSLLYSPVGGCNGESADMGKYAGTGGMLSGAFDDMLLLNCDIYTVKTLGLSNFGPLIDANSKINDVEYMTLVLVIS